MLCTLHPKISMLQLENQAFKTVPAHTQCVKKNISHEKKGGRKPTVFLLHYGTARKNSDSTQLDTYVSLSLSDDGTFVESFDEAEVAGRSIINILR